MSQFGALLTGLGSLVVGAYTLGAMGLSLNPVALILGAMAITLGCLAAGAAGPLGGPGRIAGDHDAPRAAPLAGTIGLTLLAVLAPTWPDLLPPGGASDLTHHLALVDVLARTGRLVTDPAAEAVLGEMAHYTPGIHLLIVVVAAVTGVDPLSIVHPLLALTVALKAGAVFAIAWLLLDGLRGRTALALAAPALTLWAPRAYSVDGFMQAGFRRPGGGRTVRGRRLAGCDVVGPPPPASHDGLRRADGRGGVRRLAHLDWPAAADGGRDDSRRAGIPLACPWHRAGPGWWPAGRGRRAPSFASCGLAADGRGERRGTPRSRWTPRVCCWWGWRWPARRSR
jgi:hypothetical protein